MQPQQKQHNQVKQQSNEPQQVNVDSKESVEGSARDQQEIDSVNKQQDDQKVPQGTQLSKKQLKKQQKRQKYKQMMKQKRKQQRQKQKQKKKQKKIQALQSENNQIKTQQIQQKLQIKAQRKRKQQYQQKMLDGQKVVIDLQFYDLMTQKQKSSLCKQLAYCHSVNRKMQKCFHFILTSATEERLKFMNEKYHINNFGITIIQQDILEAFNKDKIVYLTGDANEQLTTYDPEEIYVIGGIVDHNRLKRITIDYADQVGIKARRLPMEGLKLKACVHLAVNHVWEWMLRFYNGSTWRQSLQAVIPERKLQDQEQQENMNNEKQI